MFLITFNVMNYNNVVNIHNRMNKYQNTQNRI